MPRPLKRGIIGASTIILSKDINKYALMCGSNFYESDVTRSDVAVNHMYVLVFLQYISNSQYELKCKDLGIA